MVGDGSDVFDVPCVVTTKVLLTFPFASTLPTISVGFDVRSIIEGLEVDIPVGVLHASMPRSARIIRLQRARYTHIGRLLQNNLRNRVKHYATRASLTPWRKTHHKLGSLSEGIRRRTAPFYGLPMRGIIRRYGALTIKATNASCGIVLWRRSATRGSTVCLLHPLPSFLLLTKR